MLFIHYVNLTHFHRSTDSFVVDIKVFMSIELVLYFVDLFNMIFNFAILIRAHQFHFNFCCIQGWLFVIHFTDNISIIILRVMMVFEVIDNSNPTSSLIFWIPMNVTIGCTFAAMCTLFFLTVERCCATLFIVDYEIRLRKSISVFLNLFLTVFGLGACFVTVNKDNTIYLIGILLVINGFALLLHYCLIWWNRKIYGGLHESVDITSYSLTERFQVAENIKSLQMMNNIIYYMGFMNGIVVFSVLISSFNLTPEQELFTTFCLDTAIFFYSFCYPIIMYKSCDRWKSEIDSYFEFIGLIKPSNTSKVYPILNSFGKSLEQANTMSNHFDHLRVSWEAVPRKTKLIREFKVRYTVKLRSKFSFRPEATDGAQAYESAHLFINELVANGTYTTGEDGLFVVVNHTDSLIINDWEYFWSAMFHPPLRNGSFGCKIPMKWLIEVSRDMDSFKYRTKLSKNQIEVSMEKFLKTVRFDDHTVPSEIAWSCIYPVSRCCGIGCCSKESRVKTESIFHSVFGYMCGGFMIMCCFILLLTIIMFLCNDVWHRYIPWFPTSPRPPATPRGEAHEMQELNPANHRSPSRQHLSA
ncbi:hypothetical protein B9Z55_019993 [Caenorhabditis nigoni]|uniref:Uncharacterized protein n=2 Tax=Caenorhabditis nigoni TaxID=1611254 RepID=A0A2G5TKS2_9PELO|nr:hypothetical protein B9Z55_019993 [Caenorhabditis nigoni]